MNIFRKIFGMKTSVPPHPIPESKCDKDVIYNFVLRELHRNHDIDSNIFDGIERAEQRLAKIQRIRQWAAQLPDKVVRTQYSEWLDHFEKSNRRQIKKIQNPEPPSRLHDEYEQMTLKIANCEQENPLPRYKE